MSIENVRFRTEGALVVLQVLERRTGVYSQYDRDPEWRDAKVEDLLDAARFIGMPNNRALMGAE